MVREILSALHNEQDFDTLLWAYGIVCKLEVLPGNIYGFTYKSTSSIYHIFINEALCNIKRNETLLHELEHIELGHFESYFNGIVDIYYEQKADLEAHKIADEMTIYNWESKIINCSL